MEFVVESLPSFRRRLDPFQLGPQLRKQRFQRKTIIDPREPFRCRAGSGLE